AVTDDQRDTLGDVAVTGLAPVDPVPDRGRLERAAVHGPEGDLADQLLVVAPEQAEPVCGVELALAVPRPAAGRERRGRRPPGRRAPRGGPRRSRGGAPTARASRGWRAGPRATRGSPARAAVAASRAGRRAAGSRGVSPEPPRVHVAVAIASSALASSRPERS